ncbi:HutD family protein [Prodigiosinella aquatilis]|nr:HutD family protein [Prodigiosinella sp. LS101]WJV52672.1 HutD family protein [Prodigiosinella sp. LS101]WJV57026.1 HutD family protein [Pectobacteriaceae bacterium C111]
MHFFSLPDLPVSSWKNGGGETREICRIPPAPGDFFWRASIATIARDGDFSCFPGVDRIITLLSGDGVELSGKDFYHRLSLHSPFHFAGEQTLVAHLCGGVSMDFNIMTQRDSHRATVTVVAKTQVPAVVTDGVVYVLRGRWQTANRMLSVGEGMWWQSHAPAIIPQSDDALLLYAAIIVR